MIAIPSGASIYLCTSATDMRKGFDGLSGIIRTEFGREPNDGSLFLFINRRRDRIKILHWEAGGFELWYKRLEAGTFEQVTSRNGQSVVTIDATELTMLLSGVSLQSVKRRKRFGREAPAGDGVASREKKLVS
jgi:transposase